MADIDLTPSRIALGGVAAVLMGILLAAGADIYTYAKTWLLSPTIDLRLIVSGILIALGIAGVIYGVLATVREEIVGVTAYLFFPRATDDPEKNVKHYKANFRHNGLIVNEKKVPPEAFYLKVNSYAWRFLEKHEEILVPQIDDSQGHPNYEEWCVTRRYELNPRVAGRKDLLEKTVGRPFADASALDPQLKDVEYRYFVSFYDRLKKRSPPPRRTIVNWPTEQAYALDLWTLQLAVDGKIRGKTIMMLKPTTQYVRKWAERQHLHWNEKLPNMDDLLAKK